MVDSLAGWYPVKDLAAMLGVSENSIHMFRKHHDIRGRRIGRNVLLRLEDVAEMKVPLKSVLHNVTVATAHSF
jgi:hypothetical protein